MQILAVEDDFASRRLIVECLSPLGTCHEAANGVEAVEAIRASLETDTPYDLICLDIRLPDKDGFAVLEAIRELEAAKGIFLGDGAKVIMTTALTDAKSILKAFNRQCEAYITKPISRSKLMEEIAKLGLSDAHV